jgi:hypothetical protein
MRRALALTLPVLMLYSLSGTAQTTQTAPTYDASFAVGDQIYSGTTTFAVDGKGVVTGAMKLVQPTEVLAALSGAVKDGTWTFEYSYQIPAQMCDGTVKGTAKVDSGRRSITGEVMIGGACTEQPMSATFSFTKRDK